MARGLREIKVINPIPEEKYEEYKKWLRGKLSRNLRERPYSSNKQRYSDLQSLLTRKPIFLLTG
ncbi:hypothetical protein DRO56_06060 [Candidatus Bathyarchaeota archaeon]|nr:MAG: hypothetical protein DRO56_06060 [Candidatus Bathyarchaeota archaeon]